jgi:hypothetical protein
MADTTVDLITLAEAHKGLNIDIADTTQDVELAAVITAASQKIADLCGDIIATTYTNELYDGRRNRYALRLRHTPLLSGSTVTVTEYQQSTTGVSLSAETTAALSGNRFLVVDDGRHGVKLVRRSGGVDYPWWPGRRNIAVTYQSGRVAAGTNSTNLVSAKFKEACVVMVNHIWNNIGAQSAANRSAAFAEGVQPFGAAPYAVPNFVKQILAREIRPPYLGG